MPFTRDNARQAGQLGGLTKWASNRPAALADLEKANRTREDRWPNPSARKLFYVKLARSGVEARKRNRIARDMGQAAP